MLRLNRQLCGLILRRLILGPEAIQQLKTQVAPQRVLDNLAIALAHASGPHLDPLQNFFVDSYRRSNLWHLRIIASRCA